MSQVTITKNTRLDLTLTVETMTTRRVIPLGNDGINAMAVFARWDRDHLTRSVRMTNKFHDKASGKVAEVLVYESVSEFPRWMTGGRAGIDLHLQGELKAGNVVQLRPEPVYRDAPDPLAAAMALSEVEEK